jgi:hypothetical protein
MIRWSVQLFRADGDAVRGELRRGSAEDVERWQQGPVPQEAPDKLWDWDLKSSQSCSPRVSRCSWSMTSSVAARSFVAV